jgi:hypothetical protein
MSTATSVEQAALECDILADLCERCFDEPQCAMRLRQAAANIRSLMQEDPHEVALAAIEKARSTSHG